MYTIDQIRDKFLQYFERNGHTVLPSSSLVPHDDPTLLLTTAGMVQIKPYFLGEATPPNRRLASCQKCFRTTDIESVGDRSHLTFFEMLGNFSVGDYFKREAIGWAWEFLTGEMGLPPERLWITVFTDDDEALGYWRDIGIPAARILKFGEKYNFWGPAGKTGPCGPCSEIHFDFGPDAGCGQSTCAPNCDCGRFAEIWNLVFTQFNQDEHGHRTLLPRPNIDTGMGLERIAVAAGGKRSVYETDYLAALVALVAGLAGKTYGSGAETDNAVRVVAEHGRGITFLIADGVIPGNEGRGYVLRRLIRRAVVYGRRLGITDISFLTECARTTIGLMGRVYPELKKRQDFILKVIGLEEARFKETLSTGLDLLQMVMDKEASRREKRVSGEDAFRLYDTFGFPIEVTRDIVARTGFTVDLAGFEREMENQREQARAANKFEVVRDVIDLDKLDIHQTEFVGYHDLRRKSSIVKILVDGKSQASVQKGQKAGVVLESTPFYGEMGGQLGDIGIIRAGSGSFQVATTVRVPPDIIVHEGVVTEGSLRAGEEVEAEVDRERRLDTARNHTATHLLQAALRRVLGEHVQQRGSMVGPDRLRFDFSHLEPMDPEQIRRVQEIVNENVRHNLEVVSQERTYKEAVAEGAIALFNEKYGEVVRLVRVGEPAVSAELCGGTHISATGEIGLFWIIGESGIGAGLRRIEAVTGRRAVELVGDRLSGLDAVARSVGAAPDEASQKVAALVADLDCEHKRVASLERELALKEAETLLGKAEFLGGSAVVIAKTSPVSQALLREMADYLRDKLKSAVIVLGTVYEERPLFLAVVTPDLVEKGYNAGNIVREVAKIAGGGGGGKPTMAQAGGKFADKIDEALRLARTLVKV